MKLVNKSKLMQATLVLASSVLLATVPALAQNYPPQEGQQDYAPPPNFSPQQLDNLVSKIALYPDPLLAQIFAAASFPEQIQDAAGWANQYRNLRGNELADAMSQANLQFDPAVQALIPFPAVLDMMARDSNWTGELGNAVLADRWAVMDAVQRMRRAAQEYGYLRSNQQMRVVDNGGAVEIEPADPSLIYVPVYDPYVVYAPPRPGYFIGGAIGFGPYYSIGVFGGWGWGGGFNWYNHAVFVNHVAWGRTWYNRDAYSHNYGNWDRGAWRNSYNNRNAGNFNRGNGGQYRNGYGNSGGYYRGGQSAPAVQNRNFDRGNGGQYRNGYGNPGGYARGGQSAPVAPNGNGGQYRNGNSGGYYRGGQSAPVAPSQNYDRGSSGNAYRGGQSAPVAPRQSFDRGNGGQYRNGSGNSGGYYRGGQSAPVAPRQSFDRGNSGNAYRGGQSAPSQSYQRPNAGSFYRGGQSAPAAPRQSYQRSAPSTSGNQGRGQGGNGGGHFDRGRR